MINVNAASGSNSQLTFDVSKTTTNMTDTTKEDENDEMEKLLYSDSDGENSNSVKLIKHKSDIIFNKSENKEIGLSDNKLSEITKIDSSSIHESSREIKASLVNEIVFKKINEECENNISSIIEQNENAKSDDHDSHKNSIATTSELNGNIGKYVY